MKNFIVFLLFLAVTQFASAQVDRSKAPEPGPIRPLELPEIETAKTSFGTQVTFMEKRGVPLVNIRFLFPGGTSIESTEKQGLARLTSSMLLDGAGDRNALELSETIDVLGISVSSFSSTEYSSVTLLTPVSKLDEGMKIIADMLLRPTFPQEELNRRKTDNLIDLARTHDNPGAVATMAFNTFLFGEGHPYANSGMGTEASIKSYTRDDVVSFFEKTHHAGNAKIVAVGDITSEKLMAMLDKHLSGWKSGEAVSVPTSSVKSPKKTTIYIVDKPGAAQTVFRVGHAGPSRDTKDYYAINVMNTILGGSFTSRLNSNLRERNGYSYGAGSTFTFPSSDGAFLTYTNVQTDVTDKALKEIFNEYNGISKISDEDLKRAVNYDALGYPANFVSIESIAGNLSDMVLSDLPSNYFNDYVKNILNVNKKEAVSAAKKYVTPKKAVVVAVGDREKIEAGIRALKLGDVQVLKISDILGEVPNME